MVAAKLWSRKGISSFVFLMLTHAGPQWKPVFNCLGIPWVNKNVIIIIIIILTNKVTFVFAEGVLSLWLDQRYALTSAALPFMPLPTVPPSIVGAGELQLNVNSTF